MKKIIVICIIFLAASRAASATKPYELEISYNNEIFIINEEKCKAKIYYFGMGASDQIVFLTGGV